MSSSLSIIPIALLAAVALGWAVSPLDRSISGQLGQRSEIESLRDIESRFGQGLTVAILGGYRSVAANLVWLSKNEEWEKRDIAGTLGKIALATSIDPRPELFWLNGARIMANDMPTWIVGLERAEMLVDSDSGRAIAQDYAERALSFLSDSRARHASNPNMYIEEGMILWRKLNDPQAAADRFQKAIETSRAPYYAYRIYGEILIELGRKRDALEMLEAHYAELPDDTIEAMKPVVEGRIRSLRKELSSSP